MIVRPAPSRSITPQPAFLDALCLERKRAERSRRPFVLLLLDPRDSAPKGGASTVLERAVGGLLSSVRETDITGWYKEGSVVGVIFSELGPADRKRVVSALRAKVTGALRAHLTPEEVEHVHLSFHCFPEDPTDHGDGFLARTELYPDLAERNETTRPSRTIKRAIDILGSALALVLLSPLLAIIAAAIKLSSPGPILFRQTRIGQHGIPFTFLKFRSMFSANNSQIHVDYIKRFISGDVDGAGPDGKAVYKITKDPRITRVGRFLRKTSLDELPQLINVLRGEMSLVGPRPPIPYEVESYDIWHRRRLLEMKPGITGLWQVSGRSQLRFDDMVRLDLRYAKTWSLLLDIKILAQTPRAVFSGDGAY